MALNFPTSPTDGEVYSATNGVNYTYNSGDDSWTGETVLNKLADPIPSQVTATPDFVSGTGTPEDPYIITPVTVAFQQSVRSTQVINITGQTANQIVEFFNSTTPPGITPKFNQLMWPIEADGTWTGYLDYSDLKGFTSPEEATYVGLLNIGSVYFSWSVTQQV